MTDDRESADWVADVLAFHRRFRCFAGDRPGYPGDSISTLRYRLVAEEYEELELAMIDGDLPGMADAIVDLIYVLIGMSIAYGIDLRPLWGAVHAANLRKTGGGMRNDGKVCKPVDWQAPDVAGLLRKQGWEPSEATP